MTFIAAVVSLMVLFLAAKASAFKLASILACSLAALAASAAILSFDPPSEHEPKISAD